MSPIRPHRRMKSHDDGIDRWEMVEAAPAASLAGHISHYSHYVEEAGSFEARRELAAVNGVMIVALGDPLEIVGADGRAITLKAGEAFVGGAADATSLSRGPGRQEGIHIFMPLASMAVATGVPVAAIANLVVPFGELVRDGHELCGRMLDSDEFEGRFALLDSFFVRRFADVAAPDPAMAWAADRLAAADGPLTTMLADELGWGRRHFARRFRDWSGFTPERFRRIARFERFSDALRMAPHESLAALAAQEGYADQAHLTREVADFSGMTPAELRRRLIPAEGGVRD